ncbi:MAG: 2-dehydro-3-deoxyphosphogluconate aldolase/(4S)-4-hydroxy-2-oxoglutarate aldolase [Psychromonas sp.]
METITALEPGYDYPKFFPAEENAGAAALKAIAGPLPQFFAQRVG